VTKALLGTGIGICIYCFPRVITYSVYVKDTKEYELFYSFNFTQPTFQLHVVWGLGWGRILYGHKKIEMEDTYVFMKQLLFYYYDHHNHYSLHYVALP
jgi:hypothetical protein